MFKSEKNPRRIFLGHATRWVVAGAVMPFARPALASLPQARRLEFDHLHTGETISVVFAVGEHYVPDALNTLNYFLRDHYSGEVGTIDPQLFDLLFQTRQELACEQPFEVISGYRCAATNSKLRRAGGRGVARQSLHMSGRAIDIRLAGVPLDELRDAALSLQAGGVGFYPRDEFVHLDTGRVRSW
ncbi:conserved hypothetical protein [Candidatus Accumulibacter aalborgensis]|uniref:Murein endopeptidase K n=1 Tax=Candidatus Accumulibacter aalborgensis TaxID=1860102 RepID=A0A1A8Y1A1_9PROT|nr:DUF882 domain-containing protein [Candidatus Accumulibacter aalborgensis]SBT10148.1 conserved hypothetical protein [Candidatus Accumulibacter aalborgensis]